METYLKLSEQFIHTPNGNSSPLRIAKGAYIHMKDNSIMNVWNTNNVPKKVKNWATEMSMDEYMNLVR